MLQHSKAHNNVMVKICAQTLTPTLSQGERESNLLRYPRLTRVVLTSYSCYYFGFERGRYGY